MPSQGRPRLTPDDVQERVREYCRRYGVRPNSEGLPPFPTGKRETQQHRDWLSVYKAHQRICRRSRGQCQRCDAPAVAGSVFCETHRAGYAAHRSSAQPREALPNADGRCPTCGQPWPSSRKPAR